MRKITPSSIGLPAIRLVKQLAIPLSRKKTVAKWLVTSPQAGKSLVIPCRRESGKKKTPRSGVLPGVVLQRGFSILSAIFLLVVLAFLGVAMVTFSTTQHQSSAMDVMGARAYQAARAGIEWGAYQVLQNGGACAATTTLAAMPGTLSGFTVTVTCVSTPHSEAGVPVNVYQLTSTATQGAAGTAGYVERQMTVTITQ
jgi:MSHA biogenesis protein MshP